MPKMKEFAELAITTVCPDSHGGIRVHFPRQLGRKVGWYYGDKILWEPDLEGDTITLRRIKKGDHSNG